MQDFRKIGVWKRSFDLSIKIYKATLNFPRHEQYGLISQIQRAATSIPINICEGAGRNSRKDFAHFLQVAIGSANEVECELLIAKELGFIEDNIFSSLYDELIEIRKMITSFRRSILSYDSKTDNR